MCCNTVECRGSKLYCNTVYWVAVYCNTLHCIVAGRAAGDQVVSQYNLEYRGMRQGCMCRKTGSCVVIQQVGRWGARAAGVRARAGARVWARTEAQASARARQASGSWAQAQAGGSGARQGAATRGLGAGRAAWLRAVHSVHSICFRFGLTWHCS